MIEIEGISDKNTVDVKELNNGVSVTSICSRKVPDNWIKDLDLEKKKYNKPDLKYVPIDKCIRFLNENFNDFWNAYIIKSEVNILGDIYTVYKDIELEINGIKRPGSGADMSLEYTDRKTGERKVKTDVDKIHKTALANGLKKALNEFGFALELWDEDNIPKENNDDIPDEFRAKVNTCLKVLGWVEINLNTYIKTISKGTAKEWKDLTEERKKKIAELLSEKCKKERATEVK